MTMLVLYIGNLTLDNLDGRLRVGGSGYYGGRALAEGFGANVYALTHVDKKYRGLIVGIASAYGIKILDIESDEMPIFVIRNGKTVEFKGASHKIPAHIIEAYLKFLNADITVIAPVMREIEPDFIGIVREYKGTIFSIDIQGFVRSLCNGSIKCVWNKKLDDVLAQADVVHGNLVEFCFTSSEKEALRHISSISTTSKTAFLVSLDQRGTYVVHNGEIFYIPSLPVNKVDDVGAGDILLAVASYFRAKGLSVLESAVRGVIAASLKVENAYETWFHMDEIETWYGSHIKKIQMVSL
uniref:Carbohydrate kinase PfkB domain-containing protein n=1 Tax=Ignisphaera aggregans TaxID=334771 RepID=A0A7C2VNX3_9CREN